MTTMSMLSPGLRRLFERVDVEPGDEMLRRVVGYWRARRGEAVYPAAVDIDTRALGAAASRLFYFERLPPPGGDWQLDFAGETAMAWMRPQGEWRRLSHLGDRRAAVRLRHLLRLTLDKGEPVIACFRLRGRHDPEGFELALMPLATDRSHVDGILGVLGSAFLSPPSREAGNESRRTDAARHA